MRLSLLTQPIKYVLFLFSFSLNVVFGQNVARVDTAAQAMVVAAQPQAVMAGIEMLKKGGNAVDAAVATAFMAGVVEPHASGLGGGGAMLIYLSNGHSFHYVDYYMQSSLHPDTAFNYKTEARTPRAICIPGTPAGLLAVQKHFGKLPLKTVMTPAIDAARQGFVVSEKLYSAILDKFELISRTPSLKKIFFKNDLPLMAGDTLKNEALARVLRNLANKGARYFYHGSFARKAVWEIQAAGGYLTMADFAHYQIRVGLPIESTFRDYHIYSAAPPQSGTTLLEILNIWQNITPSDTATFTGNWQLIHFLCAAIKRADADRHAFLADPSEFLVPVKGLTNKVFARTRFADIDLLHIKYAKNTDIPIGNPWRFNKPYPAKQLEPSVEEGPHTTHISVVDAQGNAVSVTQTLGYFFGCGFSSQGVLFNSSMTNFYKKSFPNHISPARRPISSISPTIIMKGSHLAGIVGTPGGARIFNVLAQMIIRLIDFHQTPQQAMNAPRFSIRLHPNKLYFEKRFPQKTLKKLLETGYVIKVLDAYSPFFGGVQLIWFDKHLQKWIGVSDPRRDGGALGF